MRSILIMLGLLPLAAEAAHPLYTDDTGTQGAGGWQLELNADRNLQRDGSPATMLGNATLTFGATDTLDAFVSASWLRQWDGESSRQGAGDVALGVKWRALESGGFALALKPAVQLPTGSREAGLGNGQAFYSLGLIASWSGEDWMLMANAGAAYLTADTGNRKRIYSVAGGGFYRVTPTVRLAGELVSYSSSDLAQSEDPAFATLGLIYSPADTLDFDVGIRAGLNDAIFRSSFGAGVTWRW
ncbi:transporter [Niveibacterium umoris]|uniref:Transporter n=1 Tax=Niveibacterium umoris TaxID=1193620 RepID=A0A840BSG4_9RHOO|nr:transporter [Niveibacterium umoris]MBB4013307.1 hypothetical protein [Niveibacterium umoris]